MKLGITVKMEAANSSKTSASNYQSTQGHTPRDESSSTML